MDPLYCDIYRPRKRQLSKNFKKCITTHVHKKNGKNVENQERLRLLLIKIICTNADLTNVKLKNNPIAPATERAWSMEPLKYVKHAGHWSQKSLVRFLQHGSLNHKNV